MARTIVYNFDTPFAGQDISGELEFDDDATDDEIDEAVREEFYNHFNFGWSDK
jgi:hypothetical protein